MIAVLFHCFPPVSRTCVISTHPLFSSYPFAATIALNLARPSAIIVVRHHTTKSNNNDSKQLSSLLSLSTQQCPIQLFSTSPSSPSNFTPKPLLMRFRSKQRSFFSPGVTPALSNRYSWRRNEVGKVGQTRSRWVRKIDYDSLYSKSRRVG